jgi:pimeloyl-ACP methyl ester carboxylesterase
MSLDTGGEMATTQIPIDRDLLPGVDHLDASIFHTGAPAPVVVVATPGGGMSRRYFDLDLAGYSMATHLAGRGIAFVAVDLPGVGTTPPPADLRLLHPDTLAAILASATANIVDIVRHATCERGPVGQADATIVGLGHSMGAMLTVIAQAHHRPFDALVLLGWSGRGLPEMLLPDETAIAGRPDRARVTIADLALARFGDLLPPPASRGTDTTASDFLLRVPIDDAVRTSLRGAKARLLTQAGLWAMIPGIGDREQSAIDVPVLCGVGEMDITGDPNDLPGYLPNADVEVFVQPGAGHNGNVGPSRAELWDAVVDWCLVRSR